MATKHDKVTTYRERLPLTKSRDFKTRGPVRSLDKLKTINRHYHNTYDHQIFQGGDISQ